MTRQTRKASDATFRTAKPREKPYKLFDGGGLYLLVTPEGGRYWRLKYRFGGHERGLGLGVHIDAATGEVRVPLALARKRREEARQLLAEGIDPSAQRQSDKVKKLLTFEAVAREWLGLQATKMAQATAAKTTWLLETHLFRQIGSSPVGEVTAPTLLEALRRIEKEGKHETAHRAKQTAGRVLRYAVATGKAERDPSHDLGGALAPVPARSRPAITDPARVGALLQSIDAYVGQPTTACALKLAPLAFVRPGELRAAEWSEIDLESAEWRIPARRMKMREPHLVPLSRQAVGLLSALKLLTGRGRHVFPSLRGRDRPMSENTVNAALRSLGYSGDEQTGHGFRAMASTLLNEIGFPPEVIELQLAHAERNKVRAAYNRAQRLTERRKMMQAWADYLDELRAGRRMTTRADDKPSPAGVVADQTPALAVVLRGASAHGELVPRWRHRNNVDRRRGSPGRRGQSGARYAAPRVPRSAGPAAAQGHPGKSTRAHRNLSFAPTRRMSAVRVRQHPPKSTR